MRILWVATKAPWPARDGGRLLVLQSLEGLARAGHEITLVAPAGDDPGGAHRALASVCSPILVPIRPRPLVADAVRARLTLQPTTLVRHARPEVRRVVRHELARRPPDLVHVEQLQALGLVDGLPADVPMVLRAQNVESDLWSGAAGTSRWRALLLRGEVDRLRRLEGRGLRRCDAVVALTEPDAERLREMAPSVEIRVVTAPFPGRLEPGEERSGDPCVVLLANSSWLPNRLGAEEFLASTWPEVRRVLPDAELHVFGLEGSPARVEGAAFHPAPGDSRDAFAANGILVVPLDLASGLRMKILEAWARRVPVVATPAAARGLGATLGRELLVASEPGDFVRSIGRLHRDPDARRRLVASGAARLDAVHRPDAVIRRLEELYDEVRTRRRTPPEPRTG